MTETKEIKKAPEETFKFEAVTKYEISKEDLINLLITVGQGSSYWAKICVNFRPNKAYKKGYLNLECEGCIAINKTNFNLDSKFYIEDMQCYEFDDISEIEVIEDKTVKEFIEAIKKCLENPNYRSDFKNNLIEALTSKDYGMLDALDMDFIFQVFTFGSCVYG